KNPPPTPIYTLSLHDALPISTVAAEQAGEKGPLVQGVLMVLSQFLELLKRHGVTRIEVQQGKPFDPHLHEAIQQVPVPGQPPNRSEEHTSELQSRRDLVCRLL